MPIKDLFGLLAKRQTSPDKYLASSVNVVAGGQHGAVRAPFSQGRGIDAYRSWIYAASTINANAVASMPLRLYAKKQDSFAATRQISRGRKAYIMGDAPGNQRPSRSVMQKAAMYGDDFEEVVGPHPVLDLLSEANPFLNGFDLSVLRILYGELTGNSYLHPIIDEASGVPSELWPLAPQYVEVIPDEDTFIKGFLYGIDSTRKQVFEPDEVIHFRRPNPGNLYYGLGKVEAAYGSVLSNQAVHEMDLATFANSARPDYAVVVKGTPTGDQLDRFQSQVENRLRGTRKDGSFITVTGDVQFTPLNFPPKDIAGREEIVEEIAAVFGVPVTMLKANDPNLASSQTGFAQWREGTILPLCRMDEQELNQSLLPLFGMEETHCLAYDNPVPADRAFELQERQTAVAGGWRTPNEARLEEGREAIDDEFADQLLIGGQPLGGPAPGGLGLLAAESDSIDIKEESSPDIDAASSILDSLRSRNLSAYTATKMLQICGLSRAVAERMIEAEEKNRKETIRKLLVMERNSEDLYATPEEAEAVASLIGCSGHHKHEIDGRTMYMPCERMAEYTEQTGQRHTSEDDPSLTDEKAIADVDLQPTKSMADFASRGLELRAKHGRGGTEVGVARARDIKNRSNLSPETVGRMANFFSRHRVDLDAPAAKPGHDEYPSAGVIAWLLWGGDPANPDEAGNAWAQRKLDELDSAREKAEGDRVSSTPAEPDERIEGSDRNPEGSASGSRGGIEISEAQEKALKNKVEEHNEKHGDKKGKKVDLGMLKAVYRRGAGAFSGSHRPGMGRQQWAMARVNAFLYLVRNGKPEDSKYVTDNDLLPKGHPKRSDKKKYLDWDMPSCGCKKSHSPKVYEWPEETKWMRLEIEGLEDDFARLKPKTKEDEPTADEDIRERERKTPAMVIASVVEKALIEVRTALVDALQTEKIKPDTTKNIQEGAERTRNALALRTLLSGLTGTKGRTLDNLIEAMKGAAVGGGKAGADRLNEILSRTGAGKVNIAQISAALEKTIEERASLIVDSIFEGTVERFAEQTDMGFNVEETIDKLMRSDNLGRSKAETIARTESANAYQQGQIDAWQELGGVTEKRFLKAVGACEFCEAVDRKYGSKGKALPLDQPMINAGQTIRGVDSGGKPTGGQLRPKFDSQGIVHPNCRCDFVPVLEV